MGNASVEPTSFWETKQKVLAGSTKVCSKRNSYLWIIMLPSPYLSSINTSWHLQTDPPLPQHPPFMCACACPWALPWLASRLDISDKWFKSYTGCISLAIVECTFAPFNGINNLCFFLKKSQFINCLYWNNILNSKSCWVSLACVPLTKITKKK